MIADAGISPFKVKDIIMIIRPYPIRISNKTNIGIDIYSGDYAGSKELTWDEIKERCFSFLLQHILRFFILKCYFV